MARKRFSQEMKQEQISRPQFAELISKLGWLITGIDPDLGEDLFVRIFRNGVSTGISFQVQIKSTKDIEEYRLQSGIISYDFETEDLLHWNVQLIPVIIVIWDITARRGWGISIDEAIKNLDTTNPNWRKQHNVRVHIPFINELNRGYFEKKSAVITNKYVPSILKDKEFEINAQFTFPNTNEGKKKSTEYNSFINTGKPIELDGRYIKEIELPDELIRIFGEIDPEKIHIRMGPTDPVSSIPSSIKFISKDNEYVEFDYIKFQIIQQGKEEATLSNGNQGLPYVITFVVNLITKSLKFKFNFRFDEMSFIDANKALKLLRISRVGGTLHQKMLETGQEFTIQFSGIPIELPREEFVIFIQNIIEIEEKTKKELHFRRDLLLTHKDFLNSIELVSLLTTGKYESSNMVFSVGLHKPIIEEIIAKFRKNEEVSLEFGTSNYQIEILDEIFDLGPLRVFVTGNLDTDNQYIHSWLEQAKDEEFLKIQLINSTVKQELSKNEPLDKNGS